MAQKLKITEDDLQRQCITWFKLAYRPFALRIFHPANGGFRNAIEAAKLKAMGVLPGVCDIIITVPNKDYSGLFCELKVGYNDLSAYQEAFIKAHEKEYSCHVIRTVEEFICVVNNYFKNRL